MTDIPADILATVRDTELDDAWLAALVARLLQEERERCAKIVKSWAVDHFISMPSFDCLIAAIRNPPKETT